MKMLNRTGGFKRRAFAESRLKMIEHLTGAQSVGFVIANSDGTYTPAIWLLGNDMAMARTFAEQGIQVLG